MIRQLDIFLPLRNTKLRHPLFKAGGQSCVMLFIDLSTYPTYQFPFPSLNQQNGFTGIFTISYGEG